MVLSTWRAICLTGTLPATPSSSFWFRQYYEHYFNSTRVPNELDGRGGQCAYQILHATSEPFNSRNVGSECVG